MTTDSTLDFDDDEEQEEPDILIERLIAELDVIELGTAEDNAEESEVEFDGWMSLRQSFTSAVMAEVVAQAVDDLLVGTEDKLPSELAVRPESRAQIALALRELNSGFFETLAAVHRINERLELSTLAAQIDIGVRSAADATDVAPVLGADGATLLGAIEQGQQRVDVLKEEQTACWINALGIEIADFLSDSLLKSLRRPPQPVFAGPQEKQITDQEAQDYVDRVMKILRAQKA